MPGLINQNLFKNFEDEIRFFRACMKDHHQTLRDQVRPLIMFADTLLTKMEATGLASVTPKDIHLLHNYLDEINTKIILSYAPTHNNEWSLATKITRFPLEAIDAFPSHLGKTITELDLSDNRYLKHLPEGLFVILPLLETLVLDYTGINELPYTITTLPLTFLSITDSPVDLDDHRKALLDKGCELHGDLHIESRSNRRRLV